MKHAALAALIALATVAFAEPAYAAACANGVYRAGCVGPNGAAVVRKAPPRRTVTCANGVYRAGCVGPNGAAVVRKPYWLRTQVSVPPFRYLTILPSPESLPVPAEVTRSPRGGLST